MRWFVERMLRPDAFDPDPEPLARGGLAHAALKDTLEGLRRETGAARLTPASLGRARELLAAALEDNEAEHPLSVAPERRPGVRGGCKRISSAICEHAAQADSPLEPSALELGFGFAEGEHDAPRRRARRGEQPAAFDLGGGVRLRGRIDRVDVGAGGEAVVYDYKGRRAPAGARWIKDGNLQVALYMRAVEELLRCRRSAASTSRSPGEDLRARGVLDGDGGRGDRLRDARRARARRGAGAARRGGRGRARGRPRRRAAASCEARPQTCAFRGGCMYPTICRCER